MDVRYIHRGDLCRSFDLSAVFFVFARLLMTERGATMFFHQLNYDGLLLLHNAPFVSNRALVSAYFFFFGAVAGAGFAAGAGVSSSCSGSFISPSMTISCSGSLSIGTISLISLVMLMFPVLSFLALSFITRFPYNPTKSSVSWVAPSSGASPASAFAAPNALLLVVNFGLVSIVILMSPSVVLTPKTHSYLGTSSTTCLPSTSFGTCKTLSEIPASLPTYTPSFIWGFSPADSSGTYFMPIVFSTPFIYFFFAHFVLFLVITGL